MAITPSRRLAQDKVLGGTRFEPISVRASESVEETEGLFNLTHDGAGSNSFFVHYYAPERDRLIPFNVSIHYRKMFEAIRGLYTLIRQRSYGNAWFLPLANEPPSEKESKASQGSDWRKNCDISY